MRTIRSGGSIIGLAKIDGRTVAFGGEDIIDPGKPAPYHCQFLDAMQEHLEQDLGPKAKGGVRP